jgi:hypothetical protein
VLTDDEFCLEAKNAGQPNRFKSRAADEANLPSSPGEKAGRAVDCVGVRQEEDDWAPDVDEDEVSETILSASAGGVLKVDEVSGTSKLGFSFLVPIVTGIKDCCSRRAAVLLPTRQGGGGEAVVPGVTTVADVGGGGRGRADANFASCAETNEVTR